MHPRVVDDGKRQRPFAFSFSYSNWIVYCVCCDDHIKCERLKTLFAQWLCLFLVYVCDYRIYIYIHLRVCVWFDTVFEIIAIDTSFRMCCLPCIPIGRFGVNA